MQPKKFESVSCNTHFSIMLSIFNQKLRRLCSRLRWPGRRRSKPKVMIKKLGKLNQKGQSKEESDDTQGSEIHQNGQLGVSKGERTIRIATFNAAMFSMAPAVPKIENSIVFDYGEEEFIKVKHSAEFDIRAKSLNDRPKSILKQSPLHPNSMNGTTDQHLRKHHNFAKSKLRVSINLPDNEISLERSRQLRDEKESSSRNLKGKGPLIRSSRSLPNSYNIGRECCESFRSNRTILEVLREVDADILALQDVKAEEEKGMKPLSDLAGALGMKYVFAESWAPEYGNAVLSKWPIKRWQVQKIFDDSDFRNVLKATVDVPRVGEVNFQCTHLDHLDENWRMKQINAIIRSSDGPHILAGGLNSLDETDYSAERWTDIVKYYEEIGKPTPKVEVMKFLKGLQYVDAKDFAGECESVVMIAKGQNVQGTCKYGTRVDYILSSQDSPYKFVPGSYSVLSSKGTSDHHIVKVDMVKVDNNSNNNAQENVNRRRRKMKKKVVKITNSSSPRGIWRINT
ncbi:Endonuclease/exonuclease/phosphatase [Macleaya cordata]|uniref:Endonuclease/exonuclease/phosphatase n=1 Tax=Macleaya cordata TaxID=56857 RepID=A0A200Q1T6_MACCD|nr:Endonuclease/exonuclease/phosphatase [Macleaya cordata]